MKNHSLVIYDGTSTCIMCGAFYTTTNPELAPCQGRIGQCHHHPEDPCGRDARRRCNRNPHCNCHACNTRDNNEL